MKEKNRLRILIGISIIFITILTPFTLEYNTTPYLTREQIKEKYPDSICFDCDNPRDSFVDILLIVLLPIIVLIGIIIIYLKIKGKIKP